MVYFKPLNGANARKKLFSVLFAINELHHPMVHFKPLDGAKFKDMLQEFML
jgi:hypothetical protein